MSAVLRDRCLSGPECGLCLVRRGVPPVSPSILRRIMGPVTNVDRTGQFRTRLTDPDGLWRGRNSGPPEARP